MKGWAIFKHAVLMVLRNLPDVLRIFLVPYLLIGATFVLFAFQTGTWQYFEIGKTVQIPSHVLPAGFGFFFCLMMLLVSALNLWGVTSWHRFVLLEERPQGWIPAFRTDRIFVYFLKILQLLVIGGLCFLPVLLIIMFVIPIMNAVSSFAAVAFSVVWLVGIAVVFVILTQISPILPAAAIGKPLAISEAWEKTKGSGWSIVVLGILYMLFQFALALLAGLSAQVFLPLGIAFNIIVFLLLPMVTISILTTLYGHYVEGREIG